MDYTNAPATASVPPPTPSPSPTPGTAPKPAPRAGEITLGDQAVSVKNISIGAKRNTALLQVGTTTRTVFPGSDFLFTAGGKQQKANCTEIDRSTVVLMVEGRTEPLRLVLP